jgi:hypothetical protein
VSLHTMSARHCCGFAMHGDHFQPGGQPSQVARQAMVAGGLALYGTMSTAPVDPTLLEQRTALSPCQACRQLMRAQHRSSLTAARLLCRAAEAYGIGTPPPEPSGNASEASNEWMEEVETVGRNHWKLWQNKAPSFTVVKNCSCVGCISAHPVWLSHLPAKSVARYCCSQHSASEGCLSHTARAHGTALAWAGRHRWQPASSALP